jgi:hypothetical protein
MAWRELDLTEGVLAQILPGPLTQNDRGMDREQAE